MSIFQKSVIDNHLSQLDKDQVDKAFIKFNENYSFSKIAEIQKMKEEEYQDGFLRDIFVDVFGYTLKPADNYNLAREFKNQTDGKKADGAILKNDNAIAVIELKSTKTKDLTNVTQQAFNYKNNQPECKYVITSNFQKLRFYIDYSNEYEEFDLFNLQKDDFQLLYLLLQKDSIFTDLPLKLKTETKFHEENISDKLYKDYSSFKYKTYNNLVKNNPQYDKLTLFKKSQKFLDRLLFVFFAEDTGLVPPNAISKIIEQWQLFIDNDEYFSLYSRFVKFFIHLDKGHKYKTYDLPAYNGGLFAPDEILDNITIDDNVLKDDALLLSSYDYSTEVDVNILGHIFEHSLNEIEEITAEIEGTSTDKNKTKRKKDGVFYTPKYITQYIVENTIGKLCTEKRTELEIVEIEFDESIINKTGKVSAKGKKLFETLQAYKDWLFSLKIVDPACGSGAFLNQALNFLIIEHQQIDDIIAELTGEKLRLFDTDKTILEKNLYGVDINDESVEIAKLSLWLRTAQKGRKLSNLNNNIKCGNSLIDDPEVAGEKAFNWQNEFSEIFANGGFDVVIGNPPYVKRQNISNSDEILFLENNYQSATYNFDLYLLFIEKASKLINKNGLVSFINPSKFTSTKTGEGLRSYLNSNCNIISYVDFKEYQVFSDATTYCCIFILNNAQKANTEYLELNEKTPQSIESFHKYEILIKDTPSGLGWQFKPTVELKGINLLKEFVQTFTGIESGADNIYIIDKNEPIVANFKNSLGEIVFPVIKGTNVTRYYFEKNPFYGIIPYSKDKQLVNSDCLEKNHSEVWNYLVEHKDILENREKGKMKSSNWYGYVYPKNLHKYTNNRLIWTDISIRPQFVIDETQSWHVRTLCSLELNEDGSKKGLSLKFLLGLLNSSLFHYFIKNNSNTVRGGYLRYKPQYVKEFPLPEIPVNKEFFTVKAEQMLSFNNELQEKAERFINRLNSNFEIEKISTKLEKFYNYDFNTIISELKKQKIKLSLVQQDEWEEYFNAYKSEINQLQIEIEKTDKEIDQMVYQLYKLTDEEIAIVENV